MPEGKILPQIHFKKEKSDEGACKAESREGYMVYGR
jgi:hypothetical protein